MDRLKLAIESLQTHIDYDNRANGMQAGIITIGIAEAEALLELLKEQEGIIKTLEDISPTINAVPVVRCKDCRYGQYCTDGETTYQCFKWNSNEFGALHEQDWYCADGQR
jgi:hypothetical protein